MMNIESNFQRDGFALLPGLFSSSEVDATLASIQSMIATRPMNIAVDVVEDNKRTVLGLLTDEQLRTKRVKINDLHLQMPDVREVALADRILPILKDLLGHSPALEGSLYFEQGSAQPHHVDTLYLTPRTEKHLIAIWVALEDAHEDAGPLEYFPGSHLIEQMRFSDGGISSIPGEMVKWHAYMDKKVNDLNLQKKSFSAKKGDVFIWHAYLLHGGGPITDRSKTRRSLVFHFYSESDAIASGKKIISHGCGSWINRAHHPVPMEIFENLNLPFSEELYLARHPDVAAAVAGGKIQSGEYHWTHHGQKEGRSPR